MSNSKWNEKRERKKTLLIVEGNHEKNKLLTRVVTSFPELEIDKNNILIYETNIYVLLSKIVLEYGEDWYEQDVDIPYLFGKIKNLDVREIKKNYTNIFLIFDYERHDPNFTISGIEKMQEYFSNSEDMGKLYINYPMVESYMDLNDVIDESYENRVIPSTIKNGDYYKNEIKKSFIYQLINFPLKIEDILKKNYSISNDNILQYIECLLELESINKVKEFTIKYLQNYIDEKPLKTFVFQLCHIITQLNYMQNGNNYNSYMRYVFCQIVIHNIKKSNKIQNNVYKLSQNELKSCFEQINLLDILKKQNILSDFNGKAEISVLNTSILLIPDYSKSLIFE